METIGLRELNQNPSKAVARVRAGASIVVTDRGKPVLRMVPEVEPDSLLHRRVTAGEVRPPVESGMPELVEELASPVESLSDLMIAERNRERNR